MAQMMKVVGEEGTSIDDFLLYLKAEYIDAVYLQQDAYNDIDGATDAERQKHVFSVLFSTVNAKLEFSDKDSARKFFHQLTQKTKDWNRIAMDDSRFEGIETELTGMVAEVTANA